MNTSLFLNQHLPAAEPIGNTHAARTKAEHPETGSLHGPPRQIMPRAITPRRVLPLLFILLGAVVSSYATTETNDLNSETARTRAFAARDLGKQGGAEAVAPLITAMGDENVFVRAAATQALYALGGNEETRTAVLDALLSALDSENTFRRTAAGETLGMLEDRHAISPLIRLLEDRDGAVGHAAACALARLEANEAIDALIALARDDSAAPFARMGAAWALGTLRAEAAVQPLVEIVLGARRGQWNYSSITVYAAEALSKINNPESLPRLVEALAIEDRHLRAQLALTLEAMTGKNFGENQEKWTDYLESNS